ncbi:unnamed protein product, partial [Rotaria sp. Silwood2]
YYHIHNNVPSDLLDDLIDYAEVVKYYTIDYALNDCLSVTKLMNKLPSPTKFSTSKITPNDIFTLNYYEEEYDDVSSSDDTNYHVEMNALDDELTLKDDDILDELKQNSLIGVHVRDEPYE